MSSDQWRNEQWRRAHVRGMLHAPMARARVVSIDDLVVSARHLPRPPLDTMSLGGSAGRARWGSHSGRPAAALPATCQRGSAGCGESDVERWGMVCARHVASGRQVHVFVYTHPLVHPTMHPSISMRRQCPIPLGLSEGATFSLQNALLLPAANASAVSSGDLAICRGPAGLPAQGMAPPAATPWGGDAARDSRGGESRGGEGGHLGQEVVRVRMVACSHMLLLSPAPPPPPPPADAIASATATLPPPPATSAPMPFPVPASVPATMLAPVPGAAATEGRLRGGGAGRSYGWERVERRYSGMGGRGGEGVREEFRRGIGSSRGEEGVDSSRRSDMGSRKGHGVREEVHSVMGSSRREEGLEVRIREGRGGVGGGGVAGGVAGGGVAGGAGAEGVRMRCWCVVFECVVFECVVFECVVFECVVFECVVFECVLPISFPFPPPPSPSCSFHTPPQLAAVHSVRLLPVCPPALPLPAHVCEGGEALRCPAHGIGRQQAGREQAGREQAGREQGGREQAGREQGGREQGGREQGGREQGGREQGGREQAGREQGEMEDSACERGRRAAGDRMDGHASRDGDVRERSGVLYEREKEEEAVGGGREEPEVCPMEEEENGGNKGEEEVGGGVRKVEGITEEKEEETGKECAEKHVGGRKEWWKEVLEAFREEECKVERSEVEGCWTVGRGGGEMRCDGEKGECERENVEMRQV
ncbi:unnamed protein product [Closterium sp. NIES-53]